MIDIFLLLSTIHRACQGCNLRLGVCSFFLSSPLSSWKMASDTTSATLTPETIPLGDGPPTREEMLVYYPAKFTWKQLKTFVNSGYASLKTERLRGLS